MVTVTKLRERYFYVFGEVKNPGKYEFEQGTTVLKAITTAGGVTDIASINRTKVVREEEGMRKKLKVKMNDPVFPEDIIIVPESFF
jgi:polysaccharide export outer membrane protein